ncbi:MAG TPA: glycosyltransferase family 2 protein [Parafilimonas sp.]|nr:glycosyltransferase family 2 protein [Parafilimonas sp.]
MTISVCIPTYNRTVNLAGAIACCLEQTLLPDVILIADDSTNNETEQFVQGFKADKPVNIRYFRNRPSRGQAGNVKFLFGEVVTDLAVLLHDDDRLLPDALEKLHDCFTRFPDIDVAFGKQYYMNDEEKIDMQLTRKQNGDYYRDTAYAGSRLSSLEAGFLQQMPSDGYMLKAAVLKTVNYNDTLRDAGDFEFGLQLGIHNFKLFFLDAFTTKYRRSENSNRMRKGNDAAIVAYTIVDGLNVPAGSEKLKTGWLRLMAPVAIAQACNLNQGKKASKIFFSKYHRNKIFSAGGIKRLLMISKALLANHKSMSFS